MLRNDPMISKEQYIKVASSFGLTKRELQLGYLKVSGFSNQRISQLCGISLLTVKKHFTHIYEKAFVPGRKEFQELFKEAELKVSEAGADNEP